MAANGADPTIRDERGQTALHILAFKACDTCARALFKGMKEHSPSTFQQRVDELLLIEDQNGGTAYGK